MSGPVQFIGDWGHALGAALFAVLAIWTARRVAGQRIGKLLVAALSLTAIWSLAIAFDGVDETHAGLMEGLRNCGWLLCLSLFPMRTQIRHLRGTWPLYVMLALMLPAQYALDMASAILPLSRSADAAVADGRLILHILWALGALVLTQRVYRTCEAKDAAQMAPLAAAMAAMWGYDLLLYASGLFPGDAMPLLFALRGVAMAALVPVIALTLRCRGGQPVRASRTLTWYGLWTVVAAVSTVAVMAVLMTVEMIASPLGRAIVTGLLFALVAGALLLLSATRYSALLKLWVSKHLFPHRYDYREQWMAFVDTIDSAGASGAPLYDRLLKAMADITTSSGAVLLMLDEDGQFSCDGAWNWKGEAPQGFAADPDMLELMRKKTWVVDIGQARLAKDGALPAWIAQDDTAWAMVPLLHFGKLLGAILLGRPPLARPLDWEDFDMLRAAGRQVASYIAEARGQQELEEARRFEEFNHRFAFIMHDIKNLVSQIALVARNAERHADNPAFRKDMILTLTECTDKMNMLLARLSRHSVRGEGDRALFALGDAVRQAVAGKRKSHAVLIEGALGAAVETDRASVEQIIAHLVQNAIEASAPDMPVIVRVERAGATARIAVIDHGCGMSAEFLRDQLYRPFASTKQGGFGIGAFEARELAQALGGQLKVESVMGKGSTFTLVLPLADRPADERAVGERPAGRPTRRPTRRIAR